MSSHRTTILLDDHARRAARDLARRFECSVAEAIRRSVIGYRDLVEGVPPAARRERTQALRTLFDLFEGHDAAAEVQRLKEQDDGF